MELHCIFEMKRHTYISNISDMNITAWHAVLLLELLIKPEMNLHV